MKRRDPVEWVLAAVERDRRHARGRPAWRFVLRKDGLILSSYLSMVLLFVALVLVGLLAWWWAALLLAADAALGVRMVGETVGYWRSLQPIEDGSVEATKRWLLGEGP